MAGKKHEVLFVNPSGSPMQFSMRPCEEKSKLKSIIEASGGILTSKSSVDRDSIRLVEPGSKIFSDNCVSSKFVWDCFAAGKLLKIDSYRLPLNSDQEDFDDSNVKKCSTKLFVAERDTRARKEYLFDDDMEILNFIRDTKRYHEVKGIMLWKDMERMQVVPDRSYQSLKERFIKTILPHIHTYNISNAEVRKFKQPFSNEDGYSSGDASSEASSVFEKPKKNKGIKKAITYSDSEDLDILQYILEDTERIYHINGNTIWKNLEKNQITDHTWQSMRERFLKRILPNLSRYSVSKEFKDNLEVLIAHYGKKHRGNGKLNQSSDSELPHSKNKQIGNNKKEIILLETLQDKNSQCNKALGNNTHRIKSETKNSKLQSETIDIHDSDSSDRLTSSSKRRKIIHDSDSSDRLTSRSSKQRKMRNYLEKTSTDCSDKIIVMDSDKEDAFPEIVSDSTDVTPFKRNRLDDEESVEVDFQRFDLNCLPALSQKCASLNEITERETALVAKSGNSSKGTDSCYETARSGLSPNDKSSFHSADSCSAIQSPDLFNKLKSQLKLILNQPKETVKKLSQVPSPQSKHKIEQKSGSTDSSIVEDSRKKIQEIIDDFNTDWSIESDSEVSHTSEHLKINGRVPTLEENMTKSANDKNQNSRFLSTKMMSNHVYKDDEDSEETDVDEQSLSSHKQMKRCLKQPPVTVKVLLNSEQPSVQPIKLNAEPEKLSPVNRNSKYKFKRFKKIESKANSLSLNLSPLKFSSDTNSDISDKPYSLRSHKISEKRALRSAGKLNLNSRDKRHEKKAKRGKPQRLKILNDEDTNKKSSLKNKLSKSLTVQNRYIDVNDEIDSESSSRKSKKSKLDLLNSDLVNHRKNYDLKVKEQLPNESKPQNTIHNKKMTVAVVSSRKNISKENILDSIQETEKDSKDNIQHLCSQLPKNDGLGILCNKSQKCLLDNSEESKEGSEDAESILSDDTEIYISDHGDFSYSPQKDDQLKQFHRLKELAVEDFTEDDDLVVMKIMQGILGCNASDLLSILKAGNFFIDKSLRNFVTD